ncbi:MAG: Ger(x)C family spore germination protein [Firmicutes bacterium]|nr:Ger(x)C family spore germination protein [Bacillota bacterium]
MRLIKYSWLGWLVILTVLCLSGCWDIIPIEDRAQALVIGVDYAPGPGNENRIRLSAQIPTIKNLIQTSSPFTDRQKPVFKPLVVEGKSFLEAIQKMEDRIFQSIVIGNVKLIIVSPQVAKDNQNDLLNMLALFLRQPSVSFQTLVMCSEDSAEEAVWFEAPFELQPGLMIGKQQESSLKLIHSFPIRLWELVARIDNGIIDPYLPVIRLDRENKCYVLEGLKLFQKGKITATLSPDDSYLLGILTGKVEEAYKEISVQNQVIGFSKVQYKSKIRTVRHRNQRQLQVEIRAEGTLLQIPKRFADRAASYKLFQNEMEKQLARQILSFVKKLQALNTDPVGFRKIMEIAGVENWAKIYPKVPVDVKVQFKYRNFAPAF